MNHDQTTAQDDFDKYDLAQWDDDFVNAPVEEREFEAVPDGKYQVAVDHVEMTESQTSGNPMLKWRLKIVAPKCVGALLWRNNVIATKENVRWLKNDLHVCGLDLEKLSDLPANLERLVNIKLEVTKKTKGENENVYINRLISTAAEYDEELEKKLEEEAAKVF